MLRVRCVDTDRWEARGNSMPRGEAADDAGSTAIAGVGGRGEREVGGVQQEVCHAGGGGTSKAIHVGERTALLQLAGRRR